MKNLKRKLALPTLAILLAGGSAIMTSAKNATIVNGYQYDVQQNTCKDSGISCSTIRTDELCTVDGEDLFELQGTTCQDHLYRSQP